MSDREEARAKSDADVIDSLYGEHARREADVQDDELAQLQRLRSVFAELRAHQEEPPPAGMALLMAAARQAAEERRPRGLWARLRAGWSALLVHPGLSAAAAAVVVVGAAGYMLTRGVAPQTAAPVVSTASPAAATGPAPKGDHVYDGTASRALPPMEIAAPVSPSPASDPPSPASETPSDAPDQPAGAQAPGRQNKDRSRRPSPRALEETAATGGGEDPKIKLRDPSPTMGIVEGKVAKQEDDLAQEPVAKPAAPPPPAKPAKQPRAPEVSSIAEEAEPEPAPRGEASPEAAEDGKGAASPATIARSAERWYQLAKESAAKGNCEAVRLLGARVRAEDPAFYDKRFRADAAIKKCL